MMTIHSHRELDVWQKAMDLVVQCYELTKTFPKNETYGLSNQLQRAAVSVPANIAEEKGRQHLQEFIQHLSIAYGSLMEAETHIQIAERLHYTNKVTLTNLLNKIEIIAKMLNALKSSLKKTKTQNPEPKT